MKTLTLYRGTIEYLQFTITADEDLVDQPVRVSFDRVTWLNAFWVGQIGKTRKARVLLDDATLPTEGITGVFVRVTDSPEVPLKRAGTLELL